MAVPRHDSVPFINLERVVSSGWGRVRKVQAMTLVRLSAAIRFALPSLLAVATPATALNLSLFDSGYDQPVFLTGGGNTVYIAEQGGRIIAQDRSTKVKRTFFTVPDIVTGGEKGLLGFAFDPRSNGRFYVNVTARVNGRLVSEIRRYTDPRVRIEAPQVVLRVEQPFDNHNGGWIGFGADKNLYVAFGDGGSANDPRNNAQNKASLLGKILRIDVGRDAYPADPLRNYAVPVGNPFGTEVYAYGLRNPYRASIDRTTGNIWIGDVGQSAFEEVDRIAAGTAGQNFGWRPLEGNLPTPGVGDAIPAGTTAPVFSYGRSLGQSITGGYVFRGFRGLVGLDDRYVFGDFVSGKLWSINQDGSDLQDLTSLFAPFGPVNIASFGEDGNRNLYIVAYDGRIFRLGGQRSSLAALAVPTALSAPEPASWAMLLAGFGLVGAALRRQARAARRLRKAAPLRPKPATSSAQLAGSGTAAALMAPMAIDAPGTVS